MPIKIKYIRHHKTPICPRCGSNQTGRFVLYTGLQQERVIGKYLKNAEFVIPVTDQLSENNLFCFNCGIQWRGTITIQYLSRQEFNDIMKLLQINNMTPIKVLNEFYGEANEDVSDADIEEDTQDIVQHGNGKLFKCIGKLMFGSLLSPFKALQDVKDTITPNEGKKIS
jgi:hypothetical protein